MAEYKNYRSVNKTKGPEEKEWAIAVKMQKTIQQATVKLNNGRSYQYACRYPVAEGDVAVTGNTLPYQIDSPEGGLPTAATGSMGITSDVRPKLEIKRSHATELDYVFTPAVSPKTISECMKYLEMPGDDITLKFDKQTHTIYPITFLIRKLLAAASIIAFPQYADMEAIEKAKTYICRPQIIDQDMGKLSMGSMPELANIYLCDIQVDVDGKNETELDNLNLNYLEDGIMDGWKRDRIIVPAINEYVNKYTYIGAISIMVRGGFVNLLQAFFSANPPIKEFYDELLNDIGQTGNEKALETVKEFIPA